MDNLERRRIELYLEETDAVSDVWGGKSSDDENVSDVELLSNHNTDSEQSVENDYNDTNLIDFDCTYSSSDDVPSNMRVEYFLGKDGTKWFRKNNTKVRTITQNKVTEKSGVKSVAKHAKTEIDAFFSINY